MFDRICARLLSGVVFFLTLSGCSSTPQTNALSKLVDVSIARHMELSEVPFFPQREYQCGPAALATILSYRDIDVADEALANQVYLPHRQGSLQIEMLAAARSYGMLSYPLEADLKNILLELNRGNPVLVFQNLSLAAWPQWHYAVVVGYDLDQKHLILRSGEIERHLISMATFERTWQRAKYWAYVIVKPGEIPATADAASYVLANHALEEVGFSNEALQGYRSAVKRWPKNSIVLMALANSEYAAKHFQAAERFYKREIELRPENADAWNNLAYNFVARKCSAQARQAIRCALKLNPDSENIRQSFQEIQALGQDSGTDCRVPSCP
ncbi:PA2778 family cysteine peptidase [Thiomicrorhabdus sp. 6S3-12]|uniref:PA2778 family cysteine peptidase n=1 Tax=Thiomicrorhabdus sp. 6S3-12 TaxID=2819681 RepID=UPI001AADECC8|nr:PA2778 family cysteine peptidase [Thiomicrorhabdus sp. 6S3-12]MBO1923573.1 PA2778 family cysteine peptidase [Thiomicrorhabdus sp. 6S3-12]